MRPEFGRLKRVFGKEVVGIVEVAFFYLNCCCFLKRQNKIFL
jgi:hypothetical protein